MQPLVQISFVDAARKALLLFRLSFKSTFIYAFFVALLNQLITLGLLATFSFDGTNLSITSPKLFGLYLVVLFLVMLIGNCFILNKQNGILLGRPFSFRESIILILSRLPGVLASGIAFTLCSMIGMGLHIIPGVFFITCFYVYLPSLLFAHKRAFEAWRYSFSLIRKHFLATLALVLLSLILLWTPPLIANLLGASSLNDSSAYFGLEITGMVLLTAFALLLTNGLNLVWFYLLHKNKQ